MELEGFGASLVGRTTWVVADETAAWTPWEFLSGAPYTAKVLITGDVWSTVHLETTWSMQMHPTTQREWSALATILRGLGGAVLLVFAPHAPQAPAAFHTFLDGAVTEGRIVLTRVWISTESPPFVPDAVFFPPSTPPTHSHAVVAHVPARGGHGPFHMPLAEWTSLVNATAAAGLGVVVSDVGESTWSIFWQRRSDSQTTTPHALQRRAIKVIQLATALLAASVGGGV